MPECLRCELPASVGVLCRSHAGAIALCKDITAEQIISGAIDPGAEKPGAYLIDQWGCTHPLSPPAVVGRAQTGTRVRILHHSVSALHAQIERLDTGGWLLRDRGSLNGTFVGGVRVREQPLSDGDRVAFGSVHFYFALGPLPQVKRAPGAGRTVPTRQDDIVFAVTLRGEEGRSLVLRQRIAGGIVRLGDSSLELARLEFALMRCLVEKRQKLGDPELSFVSSDELVKTLAFKSRGADNENVRELVRRVRRKLKSVGIDGLIESRQGVGYRVAWLVDTGG